MNSKNPTSEQKIDEHCVIFKEKRGSSSFRDRIEAYVKKLEEVKAINSPELNCKNSIHNAAEIDQSIIDEIKNENFTENNFMETGFVGLDKIINPLKEHAFVVIGSKPGVGKTAFALNIVNNLCQQGRRVGFFSIEMSSESITKRLLSISSGIECDKIGDNSLMDENERDIYAKARSKIKNYSLVVDNSYDIQICELKAQARKMKEDGVEIIFIDRIRLISTPHNNMSRFDRFSFLSRNIHELSRELDMPIIVLCQLNSSLESAFESAIDSSLESREPSLADLGELESLEQDADMVIFLHRGKKEYLYRDQNNNAGVHKVKAIVAKNREGYRGVVTMGFEPKCVRFVDSQVS
uniref:DnaB-like helicase C-terminal domain-containing protein n=1 Tax=Borreliella yangtzensis TaxID=683292 RepID=UPI003B20FEBE